MMPFLIESYNAWDKTPKKKKHFHELVEEEQLMARIIAEQQAAQQQTQTVAMAAAGAGGVPTYDYFNPIRLSYLPTSQILNWDDGPNWGGTFHGDVTLSDFRLVNPNDVKTIEIYDTNTLITSIENLGVYTNLDTLSMGNQLITSIDVSNNTILTYLELYNNPLTNLDVSNNAKLNTLSVTGGSLTSLDVSNNILITQLRCNNNQITSLDVSNNSMLTILHCYSNLLTSLNVSGFTSLTQLHCYSNPLLTYVNVNNTAVTNGFDFNGCGITTLSASNCNPPWNFFAINNITGSLRYLDLSNNALIVANVNDILRLLHSGSLNSGSVNLSGGTSAKPTGVGNVASASLKARAWTVMVN